MFKSEPVLLRALTRDDMKRQWAFENDPDIGGGVTVVK